jgi:hypothetical protein
MIPDERNLCPFKTAAGYCGTHMSKPFGCRVSPFTLNRSGTLIVRNRYRLLKCYKAKGSLPAWRAHSQSLREIIGLDGIAALINRIESNSDADLYVEVNDAVYQKLVDNDAAKRGIK